MGFLDNSGDIILDAVLTDLGRKRLAAGDGSFNVDSFALGDEEINYALYQNSNHADGAHPSGSAFYDLEIIQTPVLESFTNNSSTMKSTLMSLSTNDFLFLPVLKLNTNVSPVNTQEGVHVVACTLPTQGNDVGGGDKGSIGGFANNPLPGVLFGFDPAESSNMITIDQGIDNAEFVGAMGDLEENTYIVQIDGRFGEIVDINGSSITKVTTDDDGMKFYTIDINNLGNLDLFEANITAADTVHAGTVARRLHFKISASTILKSNDSYFDQFGFTKSLTMADGTSKDGKCIDSVIRVTGVTYGGSIDIPVRFVKHD